MTITHCKRSRPLILWLMGWYPGAASFISFTVCHSLSVKLISSHSEPTIPIRAVMKPSVIQQSWTESICSFLNPSTMRSSEFVPCILFSTALASSEVPPFEAQLIIPWKSHSQAGMYLLRLRSCSFDCKRPFSASESSEPFDEEEGSSKEGREGSCGDGGCTSSAILLEMRGWDELVLRELYRFCSLMVIKRVKILERKDSVKVKSALGPG